MARLRAMNRRRKRLLKVKGFGRTGPRSDALNAHRVRYGATWHRWRVRNINGWDRPKPDAVDPWAAYSKMVDRLVQSRSVLAAVLGLAPIIPTPLRLGTIPPAAPRPFLRPALNEVASEFAPAFEDSFTKIWSPEFTVGRAELPNLAVLEASGPLIDQMRERMATEMARMSFKMLIRDLYGAGSFHPTGYSIGGRPAAPEEDKS